MTWGEKIERLRALAASLGGRLDIDDFHDIPNREPYRYASARVTLDYSAAPPVMSAWAQLAIDVTGYLTMHTVNGAAEVGIAISRPLTTEEIAAREVNHVS